MADHTFWASPDIVDAGSCVLCDLPKEAHEVSTDTDTTTEKTSFYPSGDPLALTVEPAVGSIVLDFFGVAWQRIGTHHHSSTGSSRWCSTDYALGTETWSGLLSLYSPVTAVHTLPSGGQHPTLCRESFGGRSCRCREEAGHTTRHRCRCHGEWLDD